MQWLCLGLGGAPVSHYHRECCGMDVSIVCVRRSLPLKHQGAPKSRIAFPLILPPASPFPLPSVGAGSFLLCSFWTRRKMRIFVFFGLRSLGGFGGQMGSLLPRPRATRLLFKLRDQIDLRAPFPSHARCSVFRVFVDSGIH